jgi:Fur family transcriptional regulator, ferric uptake regulator
MIGTVKAAGRRGGQRVSHSTNAAQREERGILTGVRGNAAHGTGMTKKETDQLLEGVAQRLRTRGMRRTRALDLLLREMAGREHPVTIQDLAQSGALKEQCDPATVYRLLMKLEEHGMVRRLGLHDRAAYFILVVPGRHHDYLVCTGCGKIEEVDMECPVRSLEQKLEKASGFRHVYHELEFFGICPGCHDGRERHGTAHCC